MKRSTRISLGRRWSAVPLRLIVGYGFCAHGYAKVMNGPEHFAASLHALGVPAPHVMAWATIGFELVGGMAVLLGAWIPVISVPLAAILIVAAVTVHWPYGFSSIKLRGVTAAGPQFGPPGYETDLLYIAALATLVLGGPGPFALDQLRAGNDGQPQAGRMSAPMITPVGRLFEAHLTVTDLEASIAFYRDRLGFELAHVVPARQAAFFWIGSRGATMLGLWAGGPAPQKTTTHVAFAVALDDVLAAPRTLRSAGITPLGFDAQPTDQPVVLAWMPAASIYFRDPDGHLLEYIAMLADDPRPDRGVLTWQDWTRAASGAAL